MQGETGFHFLFVISYLCARQSRKFHETPEYFIMYSQRLYTLTSLLHKLYLLPAKFSPLLIFMCPILCPVYSQCSITAWSYCLFSFQLLLYIIPSFLFSLHVSVNNRLCCFHKLESTRFLYLNIRAVFIYRFPALYITHSFFLMRSRILISVIFLFCLINDPFPDNLTSRIDQTDCTINL